MSEKLVYCIAGHYLIVETPNARATDALLPAFRPFCTDKKDGKKEDKKCGQKEGENVLFRFCGGQIISLPGGSPEEIGKPEETRGPEETGGPDETLVVDEAVFSVYHHNQEATVCMTLRGAEHRMRISADRKTVFTDLTLTAPYEEHFLTYLLRTAFGVAAAYHKTLKIHASAIEKDGKALVFLGTSGTGKSTHSRLWLRHIAGSTLLNDDEPLVRVTDDGKVWLYGAPWSGSTACYRNERAQVSAFVLLQQGPENKLTKMGALEAFKVLMQSAAIFRSGREQRERVVSLIYDVLEKVPVYHLVNRPDREAVELTHSLLN
ncbi:MAG: hypothetical protein GX281_02070 [Bacteroidales bacterium]|jgi:hypothetical protein|nr:hypothetical protein [Bacteroidales bacterium]